MGPRALYQPKPEIPEELRHHRLDLVAVARFQVAANGSVQVELVEPTPEPLLNRTLLDTLKKWRFFPALQSGKPVASTIDMRIPVTVE
jgi:protein TonB